MIEELKQNLTRALNGGSNGLIEAVDDIFKQWNVPQDAAEEIISQIVACDENGQSRFHRTCQQSSQFTLLRSLIQLVEHYNQFRGSHRHDLKFYLEGMVKPGYMPIHIAALNNNFEAVNLLISKMNPLLVSGLPTHDGNTLLHLACGANSVVNTFTGRSKLVELLLQSMDSTDINQLNDAHQTALHYAVTLDSQLVPLLMAKGANPFISNKEGITPWHIAIKAIKRGRKIWENGKPVNGFIISETMYKTIKGITPNDYEHSMAHEYLQHVKQRPDTQEEIEARSVKPQSQTMRKVKNVSSHCISNKRTVKELVIDPNQAAAIFSPVTVYSQTCGSSSSNNNTEIDTSCSGYSSSSSDDSRKKRRSNAANVESVPTFTSIGNITTNFQSDSRIPELLPSVLRIPSTTSSSSSVLFPMTKQSSYSTNDDTPTRYYDAWEGSASAYEGDSDDISSAFTAHEPPSTSSSRLDTVVENIDIEPDGEAISNPVEQDADIMDSIDGNGDQHESYREDERSMEQEQSNDKNDLDMSQENDDDSNDRCDHDSGLLVSLSDCDEEEDEVKEGKQEEVKEVTNVEKEVQLLPPVGSQANPFDLTADDESDLVESLITIFKQFYKSDKMTMRLSFKSVLRLFEDKVTDVQLSELSRLDQVFYVHIFKRFLQSMSIEIICQWFELTLHDFYPADDIAVGFASANSVIKVEHADNQFECYAEVTGTIEDDVIVEEVMDTVHISHNVGEEDIVPYDERNVEQAFNCDEIGSIVQLECDDCGEDEMQPQEETDLPITISDFKGGSHDMQEEDHSEDEINPVCHLDECIICKNHSNLLLSMPCDHVTMCSGCFDRVDMHDRLLRYRLAEDDGYDCPYCKVKVVIMVGLQR